MKSLGRTSAVLCLMGRLTLVAQFHDYAIVHYFKSDSLGQRPWGRLVEAQPGQLFGVTDEGGGLGSDGVVFRLNLDEANYSVLHRFLRGANPTSPRAEMMLASDGFLYGTAYVGDEHSGGIFKIRPDGTAYQTIWEPTEAESGVSFFAPLVQGSDGALYGVAEGGGQFQEGCVFRISRDGANYRNIRSFGEYDTEGKRPVSGLLIAREGVLLGATPEGGTQGKGVLFSLLQSGDNYCVLHDFKGGGGDGAGPIRRLILGADGWIYGASALGGAKECGTVFKIRPDGASFSVLYEFQGPPEDGKWPNALLEASDGSLYGTCATGGSAEHYGTVFKIERDGSGYRQLRSFFHGTLPNGLAEVQDPVEGLVQASDGALYGAGIDTIFRFFINAAPKVSGAIPAVTTRYGSAFSFRLPDALFTEPDTGQSLTISMEAVPPGISFDPLTGALEGVPTAAGQFSVKITATDSHPSPRSASTLLSLTVAPVLKWISAEALEGFRHAVRFQVTPAGSYVIQGTRVLSPRPTWTMVATAQTDASGILAFTNYFTGLGNGYSYRVVLP
ncbi:MAG: putative Ig domain-containing protein [Verrucomicrobia bacterium]|nr:putative Ig domain-containing protein [Verrucomicrobiota bacterium]